MVYGFGVNYQLNRELNQKIKMQATVNIICYKSKVLATGESPLMIRICKDNRKKYKSLGISVKAEYTNYCVHLDFWFTSRFTSPYETPVNSSINPNKKNLTIFVRF